MRVKSSARSPINQVRKQVMSLQMLGVVIVLELAVVIVLLAR